MNRRQFLFRSAPAFLLPVFSTIPLRADQDPDWTRPFPPFRIAGSSPGSPRTGPGPWGGLYYVGSADLASYLIATPAGLILINSNLVSSPPLIRRSVESLGFHFSDIRILLISHAHHDHCGGSAEVLKLTGAKYFVMAGDVRVVETGGRADFQYGREPAQLYPPAHVDRVLHDGDTVSLGGVVLTAHLTAGHTRGTTTWTMEEKESGPSGSQGVEGTRMLHVVIVGSPNVNPGYKLVDNKVYPQIAADYRRGFAVLASLPCDIFLGAHGGYFDLKEKYARLKSGDRSAFFDPAGYRAYIAERKHAFEAELARQLRGKQ